MKPIAQNISLDIKAYCGKTTNTQNRNAKETLIHINNCITIIYHAKNRIKPPF